MSTAPTTDSSDEQITVDDFTPELMAAAANLGMALARFHNELDKIKRSKHEQY